MESDGHAAGRLIADNLRVIREGSGVSQSVVAARMRDRGWRWHQTTVGRVEAGTQPLEYGEVIDLADILEVTTERLATPSDEADQMNAASDAAGGLRSEWIGVAEAVKHLGEAAEAARKALPAAKSSRYPRVREMGGVIESNLAECTLETALRKADDRAGES